MRVDEFTEIKQMLKSNDKDCVYLAVSMLRSNNLDIKKSKSLLKKVSLFDKIKNYSDVCKELNISELTLDNFSFLPLNQAIKCLNLHKIDNITKLFNGKWILDWNNSNQYKYYPWFEKKAFGWSVARVASDYSGADGSPGFYYNEKTAKFCGELFIQEYSDYLNN